MYSDIYRQISFKLGMMIETTKLFGWAWSSFKVTVVREIKNFGIHFLTNLGLDLDESQCVATTCWFVEGHATFILHK